MRTASTRWEVIDLQREGKDIRHDGKKLLRIYKVEPTKFAVIEKEGREFIALITRDAFRASGVASHPWRGRDRELPGYVYGVEDLWVLNEAQPVWAKAFSKLSRTAIPSDPPHWYRRLLIRKGELGFNDVFDLQEWLRHNGWKEGEYSWSKRIGRGSVDLYGADSYHTNKVTLRGVPTRAIAKSFGDFGDEYDEKPKAFYEATRMDLPVIGTLGPDLEAKALEVAKLRDSFRPAPVKRTFSDEDKERMSQFLQKARAEVLEYTEKLEQNPYTGKWPKGKTTRLLSDIIVWGNGGPELYDRTFPYGSAYTRKDVGRAFSKLLKQMEREGVLFKDETGWFKEASGGRALERIWFSRSLPY